VIAPPPSARSPLTPLRIVIAGIGVLVMLFAGGCSLYFLRVLVAYSGTGGLWEFQIVALYGGPGLLAGLAICLLAVYWRRGRIAGMKKEMVPPE